jgi:hypothetical protein
METTALDDEQNQKNLNAWFGVLRRLAQLQFDDPMHAVYAPKPLREDIQACVNHGWVMAWEEEKKAVPEKMRIMIRPEGREFYKQMIDDLASQGVNYSPTYIRSDL